MRDGWLLDTFGHGAFLRWPPARAARLVVHFHQPKECAISPSPHASGRRRGRRSSRLGVRRVIEDVGHGASSEVSRRRTRHRGDRDTARACGRQPSAVARSRAVQRPCRDRAPIARRGDGVRLRRGRPFHLFQSRPLTGQRFLDRPLLDPRRHVIRRRGRSGSSRPAVVLPSAGRRAIRPALGGAQLLPRDRRHDDQSRARRAGMRARSRTSAPAPRRGRAGEGRRRRRRAGRCRRREGSTSAPGDRVQFS